MAESDKDKSCPQWFQEARHVEPIKANVEEHVDRHIWTTYVKERMKTVSVALVLCLNIGVDPPDAEKPKPCAHIEGWVDLKKYGPQKAMQHIAYNLQKNYERWQPRARYKTACDPTVSEVQKLCSSLRRNAKEERVLFHYNGHGVPKPTGNGEIWVFNKNITQYIPLSIFDLQTWMSFPSVYVWDCNGAEIAINNFVRFANDQIQRWTTDFDEFKENQMVPPLPTYDVNETLEQQAAKFGFRQRPLFEECIQLGACRADENLPQNPDLPADLFTACLTTPIQISLHWYIVKNRLKDRYPLDIASDIPGTITDRKTPLGELNWIFTAITDTIAWHALPKHIFQRLFRQDLLIASLFRSFLLADRIMRDNGCHVVSQPALPPVHDHPLWEAWDYTVDLFLNHLMHLRRKGKENKADMLEMVGVKQLYSYPIESVYNAFTLTSLRHNVMVDLKADMIDIDNIHSSFFIEQLQAFDVWLRYGVSDVNPQPPQQLPVVLQVLLSQAHRVRALELLARFLDLGSWAVGYALSVGIFPYVLKLLQCGTLTLRPWLAFIWAKILAVESDCKNELMKDNGFMYFIQILNDPQMPSRFKIVPAFVTAMLIHNNKQAQERLTKNNYVTLCTELLSDAGTSRCRMLRLWILVGLGRLWVEFNDARWHAVRSVAYERVMEFLDDPVPEVRAAAVFSLGCLVRNRSQNNEHATTIDHEVCDKLSSMCTWDGSVLVRSELVVAVQWFIVDFESRFVVVALDLDKKSDKQFYEENTETAEEATAENIFKCTNGALNRSMSVRHPQKQTVQRSSSYVLNKAYRRTMSHDDRQSEHSFTHDKASLLDERCAMSDEFMRLAIIGQLNVLEQKSFHEPFERIWMSLLRLALDPVLDVASMAQVLIRHIVKLANSKKATRKKKLDDIMEGQMATRSEVQTPSPQYLSQQAARATIQARQQNHSTSSTSSSTQSTLPRPLKAPVKFMVGSPSSYGASVEATDRMMMPPPAVPATPNPRNLSAPMDSQMDRFHSGISNNNTSTPQTTMSGSSRLLRPKNRDKPDPDEALNLSLSAAKFTPKRNVYNRGIQGSQPNLTKLENVPESVPELVRTDFVPWCSKFFTQPILDKIYQGMGTTSGQLGMDAHSSSNLIVNNSAGLFPSGTVGNISIEEDASADMTQFHAQPSDWAYYVREGLEQKAGLDRDLLLKTTPTFERNEEKCFGLQFHVTNHHRPYGCMAYSLLRPHVFACDGRTVDMWSWDNNQVHRVKSFDLLHGNHFVEEKVNELISINGMTHELIMAGSANGLMRIWDPSYHPSSLECDNEPTQVTATYLVNDLGRIHVGHGISQNHTLYDWNQDCGRLVVAGNLRACRIWDCHTERKQVDINIDNRNGSVTGLSTRLIANTVACGFRNGTVNIYDDRLPPSSNCTTTLRDLQSTIIGCKVADEREGVIVAGSAHGAVCMWDPRMYQEPLYSFNVFTASEMKEDYARPVMTKIDVQTTGQLIACATSFHTVKIFNLTKRRVQTILPIQKASKRSAISCMQFHPMRIFLSAATTEGLLTAYKVPQQVAF
ncbi:hypothetical protein L596_020326 [Steinernema carpocapsae]|uniref:Raptor N-terminal CASPase-like domain-containing protein n=1 Tax=Steinernema carpocapsae TaxID=34508 RepID=A0A4U5MT73_STECR|nr:hypothetical protein L596_020326 [Steinernema carpocapsae]